MFAHSTSELSGTVSFNPETLTNYIEHSSALADNWKMAEDGSAYLVPGSSTQQYGSSAFRIIPAFTNSVITLDFFSSFTSLTVSDLASCNFYILADRRKLTLSGTFSNAGWFSTLFSLPIPENTKVIEIGILPPPVTTSNCELKLLSITLEKRAENNDFDNDGVTNDQDNCPSTSNPNQLDNDFDRIGNACTFDRASYFSRTTPIECSDSSNTGPDNDADGISDLCDSDDDNDSISDLDEIHWEMDIFNAFNFNLEKDTDHDNDGLLSADEIELGYSPFIPNHPPTIKLGPYLLNHDNSSKIPGHDSNLVYQYLSKNNQSFSFGSRFPNYHYELNDELLLTGTSLIEGEEIDLKYDFQPAIRIFPSPVLIDHEYEIIINTNLIYTDNSTGQSENIPAIAQVLAKITLSEDAENLEFNYLLLITEKDTSKLIIRRSNDPIIWNISKGFIGLGELDNYIPFIKYNPPLPESKEDDMQPNNDSSNNSSGGFFNCLHLLLILSLALISRTTKPYQYNIKTMSLT